MYETVVRIRGQLAELVTALDPDAISGPSARELWREFDQIERLGSAGKTLLARRVAATHHRDREGTRTAAESLAKKAGTSTAAAKEALDTSHRLSELPGVDGALRRGELSPAQAAAISNAAEADPSAEERLLELVQRASLSELREECARVKAAADPDPDATNRRIHAQRRLRHYSDAEGGWNLSARGTAQAGAAFITVLKAITDTIVTAARRDGRHEPVEAYAFDALMAMAQHAAGGDEPPGSAAPATGKTESRPGADQGAGAAPANSKTEPGTTAGTGTTAENGTTESTGELPHQHDHVGDARRPAGADLAGAADANGGPTKHAKGEPGIFGRNPGQPVCPVPPRHWSNPRHLALLRIDVAALRRGRVEGEELCEIDGVGPVPVSVARDLLGEAIIKLVITDGVDVISVTHLGRGPTIAQKIALMWSNPTCTVEGCPRRRIEYDHQKPWAQTRHTQLGELDPLCAFHHDLKTRLGWALVPGKGKRPIVPPDDPRHPRYQPARTGPPASANRATTASGKQATTAPKSRPVRQPASRSRAYRQPGLPTLESDDP